jgi:hypothetical protein
VLLVKMFRPRFATKSTHSPVRDGSDRPDGDAVPTALNLLTGIVLADERAVAADGNIDIDRFVELLGH